jgi:hypothetical protein
MLGTRPDLAYSVIKMSQYSANPSEDHLNRALYIVRYLAYTKDTCITFNGLAKNASFTTYCDTDWAGDLETRRSTTGYCIFLADAIVSWCSRRQKVVVLSSTEAEYIAMTESARQLVWIRNLFKEIGHEIKHPLPLNCDNQGAMFLAENPAQEGRSKHIAIKYHYIREAVQEHKQLELFYVPTQDQRADIFTKNVTFDKFRLGCLRLGLTNYPPKI